MPEPDFIFEEDPQIGEHHATFFLKVPRKSHFFDGHFDGDPILPGVAQVAELVVERIEVCWPDLGAPSGIPRLKFSLPIRPGSRLELRLDRDPLSCSVRYSITCGGQPASAGTLSFAQT